MAKKRLLGLLVLLSISVFSAKAMDLEEPFIPNAPGLRWLTPRNLGRAEAALMGVGVIIGIGTIYAFLGDNEAGCDCNALRQQVQGLAARICSLDPDSCGNG